jgi:hypothetical protein
MLNTVPSEVKLTDVITPLPVKPHNVVLTMAGDTLKLSGQVRVRKKKNLFRLIMLILRSFGT